MNNWLQRTKRVVATVLSIALIFGHLASNLVFAAHDDQEIYSVATDIGIQSLDIGDYTVGGALLDDTAYLSAAGSPVITAVANPHGGNAIELSGRTETWYALDLNRLALGLTVGQRYNIRVAGRVVNAPADTQVIVGGADSPWSWLANQTPDSEGNFNMILEVNAELLEDPQVKQNFRIQTNNTATFIIDEIVVMWFGVDNTWTPPTDAQPELPPVEPGTIFNLAEDMGVQELAVGTSEAPGAGNTLLNATPYIQRAGQPTLTIVEHPVAGNSIQLTARTGTYHAIDLVREALEMEEGHLYTVRVAGRVLDFNPDAGTQIIIGGAESPWGWLSNTAPYADGRFDLSLELNSALVAQSQIASRIRLQTNDLVDFIIDEIVVTLDGRDPAWRPPGYVPSVIAPEADGYVLRVETLGGQQWDGIQVSTDNLALEAGNVYEFTFDLFVPHVPEGGFGLLLQTNGPRWEHVIPIGLITAEETGVWTRFTGSLDVSDLTELNFDSIQIVKDGGQPNASENVVFLVDNFAVERATGDDGVLLHNFHFDNRDIAPFIANGSALLSIDHAVARTLVLDVTFGDDWADIKGYCAAGHQMTGARVENQGRTDDYSFRLENITGNFTSGDGNYFRLDLPEPLQMGGTYEISWWVYVPSNENPNVSHIVGPGIVFNSIFGSPAHQPTNTKPLPGDLQRRINMDEWVQTTITFDLDHTTGDVNHLIFRYRVNNDYAQPSVYFIDDIVINSLGHDNNFVEPEWDLTLPSLAEIYDELFLFGNILEPTLIDNNPRGVKDMFLHHYNAVTAENAMKPDTISGGGLVSTRPESLLLDGAESMVSFAEEHDLYMVGHTLIWHEQSALWLYRNADTGDLLTREEAMENMRWFIEQYAGHFEGRIHAWDVTNEVFTNSGGANNVAVGPTGSPFYPVGSWQRALRNYASWYHAFANEADFEAGERGWDYIYYSFVFARRYAPSALLIYNDFNEEFPAKRDAIANMTEELNERWANDAVNNPAYGNPNHPAYGRLLIEAIGMQAHYNQNTNWNNVYAAIERFAATGARIQVTELDIQFTNAVGPFELSEAQLQLQADWFAQLFRWYVEFSDYIDRVSIWGREDGSSWRGQNGATHFDRFYNPKPAFWAIVDPFGHIGEDWPERPMIEEPHEELEDPVTLNAPTALEIELQILTWEEEDHAIGYEIYVNPTIKVATNYFDLSTLGLEAGIFTVQVRALGDGTYFLDSELSNALQFAVYQDEPKAPPGQSGSSRPQTAERPTLPQTGATVNSFGLLGVATLISGIELTEKKK